MTANSTMTTPSNILSGLVTLAASNTSTNSTRGMEEPQLPLYLPLYVTVLNVLVFMTGIVGNLLVIVVVVRFKDMRTPMNWYLVNLSLADLLVLLVCQPTALIEFFARDRWYLGEVMCKLVPALEHAVWHTSTLTIITITVERYYAICRPLRKLAICYRPRPLRVLPVLWSMTVLTSLPFVFMTRLQDSEFVDGTFSKVCGTRVDEAWHYWYVSGMTVLYLVLPMFLLSFLYIRIIACLLKSERTLRLSMAKDALALSAHGSRKQVVKVLVGIVILFFVSLIPLRGVILWQIFVPQADVRSLGPEGYYNLMWLCRLLMYVNSAGNPIIYSMVASKFQVAFWRLLRGSAIKSSNTSTSSLTRYVSYNSSRHGV